jgi:hypothetical protein
LDHRQPTALWGALLQHVVHLQQQHLDEP